MASFSNKPVTLAQAVAAIACTMMFWLGGLTGLFLWAQNEIQASFPLKKTPLAIQIPKFMPVVASVNNQLNAQLKHTLDVAVPIDKQISARLPKDIPLDINLQTMVQLNTDIDLATTVAVDTVFELNAPIDNPLAPFHLPIKLPLKFNVPVDLTIPINDTIPLNLNTSVIAKVHDPVPAQFQATLYSQVPIDTTLNASVISKAEAHLMIPTTPIELELTEANLRLAMDDISLITSPLNRPAKGKSIAVDSKDLIYVYDAKKKPPIGR